MSIVFLNNEFVDDNTPLISHHDSGFTTGIGIFDSMLTKDGNLVHGQEHFERITHDTRTVIGLTPNLSYQKFKEICTTLLKNNNLNTNYARIRTTVTGGEVNAPLDPASTLTILMEAKSCDSPDNIKPVKCAIIQEFPRIVGCNLENCKRLDYTRSYAARRKSEALGAEEAILTNTDGNIVCGATSNIFIEESGALITPPLSDGVLAGVTRRKLMEEREVIEESISIKRLKTADKIYLTNSFIGLRPAVLIG